MAVNATYPGEYIREIPSGVRTIIGVATSVAAFVGRARVGPVDVPVTINDYSGFERIFGGLWQHGAMSYAVRDFFRNGGGQAVVIRVYRPETGGGGAPRALAVLDVNGLALVAASPGAWGNSLRVRVDKNVKQTVLDLYGLERGQVFNLAIRDLDRGIDEYHRNLTSADSPRRVDRVLQNQSNLVRTRPGVELQVPGEHSTPAPGRDPWSNAHSTHVIAENKASDGAVLTSAEILGSEAASSGMFALDKVDVFNLLCIPPYLADGNIEYQAVIPAAARYCERRRAVLLIDSPSEWADKDRAKQGISAIGTASKNASVFFPRLLQPNPLRSNRIERFASCGAVAGVIARTDGQRGVWKAPSGTDAALVGAAGLDVSLTDADIGELDPLGINCLRPLPTAGFAVWGARTLQRGDRLGSEWKYLPVRRLILFIEDSLYRGTRWAVAEPNDETLWSQLRFHVASFMHDLFRRGVFHGKTPNQAYFVKCDRETTTRYHIDRGVVNVLVGFAPLNPAGFVLIKIQQSTASSPLESRAPGPTTSLQVQSNTESNHREVRSVP
ncbi:MAG: phage tail sheath subtilisin-like domain-containing protein [Proteobacteria bacterium]|nr:phage tail sheath subtilisin-like domain-containing protein [Pseudomonadota bacterium]